MARHYTQISDTTKSVLSQPFLAPPSSPSTLSLLLRVAGRASVR